VDKDEALRMALEALENNRQTHNYCEDTWYSCPKHEDGCANDSEGDECNCGADNVNAQFDKTIIAIKEALAQSDQEPDDLTIAYMAGFYDGKNKYAPQPEQEPVAWRTFDGEGGYDYRSYEDNESYADEWDKRNPNHKGWVDKLYTAAPQRKPCTTCEALARSVMMDQTGRDA